MKKLHNLSNLDSYIIPDIEYVNKFYNFLNTINILWKSIGVLSVMAIIVNSNWVLFWFDKEWSICNIFMK